MPGMSLHKMRLAHYFLPNLTCTVPPMLYHGPMATNLLTTDQQYDKVYTYIAALSAVCDGAISLDGQGFNGQDTKFGKRIASVPREMWTPDVCQEAARICLTYKQQILKLTGEDCSQLDVVRAANGLRTNHQARWDARGYERRAKNADKMALRRCDAHDGKLALSFHVKDPDFGDMKVACQKLPTRRFDWDIKAWVTPVSDEVEDILLTFDFNVTDDARALLNSPRVDNTTYHITLHEATGRLVIDAPRVESDVFFVRLEDARGLPGREFNPPGFGKVDVVNASPQVLVYAEKWHLTIHPDALLAIEKARQAMETQAAADLAEEDYRTLMVHVSRLRSPEQLPPVFLEMLGQVINHG